MSECQRSERIFCPRIQTEHTPAPRFKPTRPHTHSQSAPDFQKQTTSAKPMTRAHPEGTGIWLDRTDVGPVMKHLMLTSQSKEKQLKKNLFWFMKVHVYLYLSICSAHHEGLTSDVMSGCDLKRFTHQSQWMFNQLRQRQQSSDVTDASETISDNRSLHRCWLLLEQMMVTDTVTLTSPH